MRIEIPIALNTEYAGIKNTMRYFLGSRCGRDYYISAVGRIDESTDPLGYNMSFYEVSSTTVRTMTTGW